MQTLIFELKNGLDRYGRPFFCGKFSPIAQLVERAAVTSMKERRPTAQKKEKRTYSERREYLIAAVQRRRHAIREKAIAAKGRKCEICGYSRCKEALEFHHLKDSDKNFGLSEKGYARSWQRVKKELEKCVLLCANCHREIHAKTAAPDGNVRMKSG